MSAELCGTWLDVEGFETHCAEPIDHAGPCKPALSDCLREIDYHARIAAALSGYVRDALSESCTQNVRNEPSRVAGGVRKRG